jgi:hypothetical protein
MGGGGMGGMRPPMGGGGMGGEAVDHPITIRSTTDTDLLTQSGVTAPKSATHAASVTKDAKTKKSK